MTSTSLTYQTFCGPAPTPGELLLAWNFTPALMLGLTVCISMGLWHLRAASAPRVRAFGVASLGAILAFVSPLCALTVALFAARSAHHLILLSVIAPALAVALPVVRVSVAASFVMMSAALWAWHLPVVYSAAWTSTAVYWLMQFALLLPAWAFWSRILAGAAWRDIAWLGPLVAQMGFLGAILTFAGRPFYLEHLAVAERFGLTALQDQQLAGLIMWVPGMLPLAAVAAYLAWARLGGMREA